MPRKPLSPNEPMSKFLIFANAWSEHYQGEIYYKTAFDLKLCKELSDMDADEQVRRQRVYFSDSWYGNCRHSLAAFVKNVNKFIPEKKQSVKRSTHHCPMCDTDHPIQAQCPPKRDVSALPTIGKRIE